MPKPPANYTGQFRPSMEARSPQSAFLDYANAQQGLGPSHLVIVARAGTGKTTTLVEGLKVVKGLAPSITPSPQQQAIWDALCLSGPNDSYCFCAFNNLIATELERRVPEGCFAMTLHKLGYRAVLRHFGRVEPVGWRVIELIAELEGRDSRAMRNDPIDSVFLSTTNALVGYAKQNLVDPNDRDALQDLADHHNLEDVTERVLDMVPRVMERSKDVLKDKRIDFNDQIWLPVVLDLPMQKYDVMIVDEAQDLNRSQQELALKAGRRIILCGDPKQAIYGFAGADSRSLARMTERLGATPVGCETLPLTVTRRCGKAIVAEARRECPDFEAHESNPDGLVKTLSIAQYRKEIRAGDMLVCRVNAPLVGECFRLLSDGHRATIQGRKIGETIVKRIKGFKAKTLLELVTSIDKWTDAEREKELAKKHYDEQRLIDIEDIGACLKMFVENTNPDGTVNDVIAKVESMFDDSNPDDVIKLSSIHKAKGLEAERIFFYRPKGASCPHPMAQTAWQKEQEFNLWYVAVTRAITALYHVTDKRS